MSSGPDVTDVDSITSGSPVYALAGSPAGSTGDLRANRLAGMGGTAGQKTGARLPQVDRVRAKKLQQSLNPGVTHGNLSLPASSKGGRAGGVSATGAFAPAPRGHSRPSG